MTNGDKIRQMSNEELARFIQSNVCDFCKYTPGGGRCILFPCNKGIKAYLESEVNDD